MKIRSEDIAFSQDELAACGKCGRQNPPTRIACLYCGEAMNVSPEYLHLIKPVTREIEAWELGFSIVISPGSTSDNEALSEVARITGLSPEHADAAVSAGRPVPVIRVAVEAEAETIAAALTAVGFRAFVLSDEELRPQQSPERLRAIEFDGPNIALVEFNLATCRIVAPEDLVLMVSGVISDSRTDQLEKKRRGKETKVLNEVETESDQPILDIYLRDDTTGSRITLAGFDFSCLGEDKTFMAAENLRTLTDRLRRFAPEARYSADHFRLRDLISAVWPPESRKDSRGMQRSGFGKFEYGSRITSSNLSQMNRFSRLERHLL